MKDYYAAAAQIIPLLVLALLVDQRITGSNGEKQNPGKRAIVIFLIGVLTVIGEGAALQVLLEGGLGSPSQAAAVIASIAGLTIVLFVVTIAPSVKAWWEQPGKRMEWRPGLHKKEEWILLLATVLLAGLVVAASQWAKNISPQHEPSSRIDQKVARPSPPIHQLHKVKHRSKNSVTSAGELTQNSRR